MHIDSENEIPQIHYFEIERFLHGYIGIHIIAAQGLQAQSW